MSSKYEDLEKLRDLYSKGILTEAEFNLEKERVLKGNVENKPGTPDSNRSYNVLMHLSQFSNYFFPFLGVLVPIVMWATRKDESESVDTNGKIILNWTISTFIYGLVLMLIFVAVILVFGGTMALSGIAYENGTFDGFLDESPWMVFRFLGALGVVLLPLIAIGILDFVFTIMGAVKASNGELWNYPLSIRFFKTPPSSPKTVV
jgi:uncharacterized Tic20 family protein